MNKKGADNTSEQTLGVLPLGEKLEWKLACRKLKCCQISIL